MFLFSVSATLRLQLSGVVSDASGPIPGANVTVKGTKNSVATGFDGNYSIANVPSNGVLVFSFLGLTNKEIPVAGKNKINVVLEENPNDLQEVVVIGYGTQRKEAVTGSVSSIKGDVVREVPAANITQALQGRLAGSNEADII